MTLREIQEQLFARGRFGMKPGLDMIRLILDRLGNPEASFPVIHIAGTNGKGSTAAFLSAILAAGGRRVGLYTSPHLIRYTERFRVNGAEISEEDLAVLAAEVLAAAPETATFFEITTAIAFLWFARQRVELAIMEVGMGGRFDATNAVPGILSIITPISLDHCLHLGETVAAIAGEKAGVIAGSGPTICASQTDEALRVIAGRCAETGSRLVCYGRDFSATWEGATLSYEGLVQQLQGVTPGIPGAYQQENAACALAAAELLAEQGVTLSAGALRAGIATATWPGRMELFPGPPRIMLDGAHNPDGARALARSLVDIPRRRLILVTGVMADKDVEGLLVPLFPLVDEIITVAAALPQATPAGHLAEFCSSRGVGAVAGGSVRDGLSLAIGRASVDDLILVAGSLYVVGEARGQLLAQSCQPCHG